jgi:hypothetical protein
MFCLLMTLRWLKKDVGAFGWEEELLFAAASAFLCG